MEILNTLRKGTRRLHLGLALSLAASLGAAEGSAPVWQQVSKEYQVKAVFLFHFAQFVEWPESAFASSSSPIVLGVLGDNPFGGFLEETVRGERVRGRPLSIQKFKDVDDIRTCHVLFVSGTESPRIHRALASLENRSVLTVGDAGDFSKQGGMIRFAVEQDKTKLFINVEAAKAAGLTISSKLLRAAQIVTADGR